MGKPGALPDGLSWLHYDGKVFSAVTSGAVESLRGLWAAAPDEVWAAGDHGVVVHWLSGTATRAIVAPGVRFQAASGTAPGEVWAVGWAGAVYHYRNGSWSQVASGTSADLDGVWALARDNVWIVGSAGTVLHWDGATLSSVGPVSAAALHAVWASAATDVWAVGDGGTIVHFDGHAWATSASGTSAELRAIWGSSAHDLWAGGLTMLHGDGARWVPAAAGLPAGRGTDPGLAIQSLTGLGGAVLAVGTPLIDSTEPSADAFRWDGARWVRLQTGTGRALLSASSAGNVLWTAGELGTLLERRCAAALK